MHKKLRIVFVSIAAITCLSYLISCSKDTVTGSTSPGNSCNTVIINDSIVPASASCASDGSIIIKATGSTGLMFKIGSGGTYQSIDTFRNIAAGTYTIYVKDTAGCVTSGTVTVTARSITINATTIPSDACGSDGAIFITASGSSSFMYKLNAGGTYQTSDTFINVAPATYTVYVKDSSGCETTRSVVVAAKVITITSAVMPTSSPCGASDGSIIVTATGSSSFMYKLNNSGTYQTSDTFTNVASGTYTVYVKDSASCETTANVTVGAANPGTLFASVKSLIATKCQSCHNNSFAEDGYNWQDQCNIILYQNLIQQQVNSDQMPYGGPPLSTSEKDIINNWISAGGAYGN
jgi:hypothetical protein